MKKIVIQAGHINCANISIPSLRRSTGAPGEQAINKAVADRLSSMLRDRGFSVIQTDACANSDTKITKVDQDLFLALHCDADYAGDNGSGFADFPQPATDGATNESQRIVGILNDVYFKESGIKYVNHSNENTRYYYMWKYLTGKTPCALIEMGQAQDPHDKVLLANTTLIASSLARAICKAFGVVYDLTPQVPPVVVEPPKPVIVSADDAQINLGSVYGIMTLKKIKELIDTFYSSAEASEIEIQRLTDQLAPFSAAKDTLAQIKSLVNK